MAHGTHADIANRLKRAGGHLKTIIAMIEAGRECVDVAQQLHAVARALETAKQIYIRDHIDNCLVEATGERRATARRALAEFKEIAKYL